MPASLLPLLNNSGDNSGSYTLLPSHDIDASNGGVELEQRNGQSASNGQGMARTESPDYCDFVQFTSAWYYASEDEGGFLVEVMRIGQLREKCSVSYRTIDGSAVAGEKYVHMEGTLEFAPGEHLKGFTVELIDDDLFNTILEVGLELFDPVDCELGEAESRAAIVDDDYFPSNKLKEVILAGTTEIHKNSLSLIFGFLVHAYRRIPTVWWKAWLIIFIDLFQNMYYLLTIYIKVRLVDSVLHLVEDPREEEIILARLWLPGDRRGSAVVLALMWVLPNFLLTGTEFFKVRVLEVGFSIRKYLRVNIFRKFLNASVAERVPIYELMVMVKDDVGDLVENGFMKVFELFSSFVKICCVFFFMARKHPQTSMVVFVFPTVMSVYLSCRRAQGLALVTQQAEQENQMLQLLIRTAEDHEEIQNYNQRSLVVSRFSSLLDSQHHSSVVYRLFRLWNSQLVPWITLLQIGGYIVIGSRHVLDGHITLGTFVATIAIFKDLGDRFDGIYDNIRDLLNTADPLTGLTEMLNIPTDILDKRQRCAEVRSGMQAHVQEFNAKSAVSPPKNAENAFDSMDICLSDVSIAGCLSGVTTRVAQGSVVLIEGPHASGKASVARLLAACRPPDKGLVQCGLHMRRIYVSKLAKPIDWLGLYGNCCFGSSKADPNRVRRIAKRAKLGKDCLKRMDAEIAMEALEASKLKNIPRNSKSHGDEHEEEAFEDGVSEASHEFLRNLTTAQRTRLLLVRALVFNPEVLVLHSPVDSLDDDAAATVLLLLREFVDQRGVECPGPIRHRRPRTVFFTCGLAKSEIARAIADVVWECGNGGITATTGDFLNFHDRADLEAHLPMHTSPGHSARQGAPYSFGPLADAHSPSAHDADDVHAEYARQRHHSNGDADVALAQAIGHPHHHHHHHPTRQADLALANAVAHHHQQHPHSGLQSSERSSDDRQFLDAMLFESEASSARGARHGISTEQWRGNRGSMHNAV